MDGARPDADSFAVAYDEVFGRDFDWTLDYPSASDSNGHYEQIWHPDLPNERTKRAGRQVKFVTRTGHMLEALAASPNNRLRTMNDAVRSCCTMGLFVYRQRERMKNPVLDGLLEVELRELKAQAQLAFRLRRREDDKNRRDGILELLSYPYNAEDEFVVRHQLIPMLENAQYRLECMRALEDYCGKQRR